MKLFTIIGNFQKDCIYKFLITNSFFKNMYEYIEIKDVNEMNKDELDNLYNNILPKINLLIIQPISVELNKNILTFVNNECIKILIPILYFNYYHPFYIKNYDINLLEIYKKYNYQNINFYINKYNDKFYNINLLDKSYFNNILIKEINNIKNNELKYKNYCSSDTYIINISLFITNNYNKKLLFYAPEYPSKDIFQFIVSSIFIIMCIQLDDYPEDLDPFRTCIVPLYSCIINNINFDINKYQNNVKEFVQKYIESNNEN